MNHSELLDMALNQSVIQSKTFQLKTITPLGIHGASDSGQEAEFRITSLRGLLRYWWRAVHYEQDYKKLLRLESEKFGGTIDDAQKSPVSFVLEKPVTVRNYKKAVLPHRGKSFPMACLPENEIIPIKMKVKRDEVWTYYENILLLFSMLGSMGQRARRGFGSIQLSNYKNVDDFNNELMKIFDYFQIKGIFNSSSHHLFEKPNFQKLSHPTITSVWIGQPYDSSWNVVKAYGEASRKNHSGLLGRAKGGRFASPLWGSVKQIGDKFYPVVTELQSQSIKNITRYEKERNEFLKVLGVSL